MEDYLTKQVDINDLAQFLKEKCDPSMTKVYLGCDSEKFKIKGVFHADYSLVAVVHVNGKEGCKIFGEVVRERDFDTNRKHPRMRLMNEAIKVAAFYRRMEDTLFDFYQDTVADKLDKNGKTQLAFDSNIEIHLDINPNPAFNSSIVINEAVGYIKGMTNIVPFVKPEALASSFAADRYKEVLSFQKQAAKAG